MENRPIIEKLELEDGEISSGHRSNSHLNIRKT